MQSSPEPENAGCSVLPFGAFPFNILPFLPKALFVPSDRRRAG